MDTTESMKMVALPVYRQYLGVSNYFRREYDYMKYGFAKCNFTTFEKRGDWNVFWRLLQTYKTKQELDILFAANLHDKTVLPMHLTMESCAKEYRILKRMIECPVQEFLTRFGHIVEEHYGGRLDSLFRGENQSFVDAIASMRTTEKALFEAMTRLYCTYSEKSYVAARDKDTVRKIANFFNIEPEMRSELITKLKSMVK